MYQCGIRFYLVGCQPKEALCLKEMPPLEGFAHSFSESGAPDSVLATEADVILADLRAMDVRQAVQALLSDRKEGAELILLAGQAQLPLDLLPQVQEVWTAPLAEEELRFQFLRWQRTYKLRRDYWQTSQFWETTINSVPNLVWYKSKDGVHEKVNDSFCRTVNKSKEQVQGQRHAYIWDVEFDDPACIESERIVMETRQTCVSEEIIQTGEGKRLLTTYKSPLYDLDGSVMGTVGVAIDVTQERAYEEEIISKNHTLETLFTTMDCGIMYHTLDGSRILSVNRAALKILGFESAEELIAAGFDTVAASVIEEDRERLRTCIQGLKKVDDRDRKSVV